MVLPMLFHLILTVTLLIQSVSLTPFYVFLRSDCQLFITKEDERSNVQFDITPSEHASCQDAEILEYTASGSYYLIIASYASETTLNMAIVPIDLTPVDSPTTIETELVDFSHVLTDDCRFNYATFAMGLFGRILYFVASCESGKSFALARGVIGLDGQWYIPYGPPIPFVGNDKTIDGIYFWNHKFDANNNYLKISLYMLDYSKPNNMKIYFDVRHIHSINTTEYSRDSTTAVKIDKFRSASAPLFLYMSWRTLEARGCFSYFYEERNFYIGNRHREVPEIVAPCYVYTAQRVENANAEKLPDRMTFKFFDATKSNVTFECEKFSKTLGEEGDVDCGKAKRNNYSIIMGCIIGVEVLFVIAIGVTALALFLKEKFCKSKKGAKTGKTGKKKDVIKKSDDTKTDKKDKTDKTDTKTDQKTKQT
uniref:Uncharacterized protein n=1 Tax=Panagrellus redivivus TaxID=6233 RepID=A0A7E4VFB8_PANRE